MATRSTVAPKAELRAELEVPGPRQADIANRTSNFEQTRKAHAFCGSTQSWPAARDTGARRRPAALDHLWPYGRAYEKLRGLRSQVAIRPEKLIASIRAGPQGPRVIAAFDFDGTL